MYRASTPFAPWGRFDLECMFRQSVHPRDNVPHGEKQCDRSVGIGWKLDAFHGDGVLPMLDAGKLDNALVASVAPRVWLNLSIVEECVAILSQNLRAAFVEAHDDNNALLEPGRSGVFPRCSEEDVYDGSGLLHTVRLEPQRPATGSAVLARENSLNQR